MEDDCNLVGVTTLQGQVCKHKWDLQYDKPWANWYVHKIDRPKKWEKYIIINMSGDVTQCWVNGNIHEL
mgnify:CR=1 FL=1